MGKVTVVYTGSLSGLVVDSLDLTIERGKPVEVPKAFADEKIARDPKHWKLAKASEKGANR